MLHANLISHTHYAGDDLSKLQRSLTLLGSALNGSKFREAILAFDAFQFVTYTCRFLAKPVMHPLEKLSNEEILQIVLNGSRKENEDSYMDLKLRLLPKAGGSAVGYTDENDQITTYRSAFNRMEEGELAAHLVHEWSHTLGFEHSFNPKCDKTRDRNSIPYAIGNMVEIILTGKCWYGYTYPTLNQ